MPGKCYTVAHALAALLRAAVAIGFWCKGVLIVLIICVAQACIVHFGSLVPGCCRWLFWKRQQLAKSRLAQVIFSCPLYNTATSIFLY
ncbi:MAG: hypothetical protein EAY75_13330 [Bacteroidetes bacterium]|nr:MAG: hypothetical protein EAY75_13330 [Bacteroidota bacterium]